MSVLLATLRTIAETLDGLSVAMCVFDDEDRCQLWNRAFVTLFPEHAAFIHAGEPYRDNLRRFYQGRLDASELPSIERYIDEGVARHRSQQRPFSFEHRGARVWVTSLALPGVGRIRMWKTEALAGHGQAGPAGAPPAELALAGHPFIDGATLFDHVADGIMVTGDDDAITWVNEPFVLMYGLSDRATAAGARFEDIYRAAWRGAGIEDRVSFERGMSVLADNLRFAGAPFEMPLPGGRWTRVVHQRSPDGRGFFVHVDISMLKRQQDDLRQAERRAHESKALLEATLERMEQGIMMVNAERVVEVCNRRAIELLDLPEALMKSRPTAEQVLSYQLSTDEFDDSPLDTQEFVRAIGIIDQPHFYDRKRPDGRVIEIHSVPITGGGVLRTYTDITERRRQEERIRHIASHDGLTSLVNREAFLEQLAAAVESSRQTGAGFAVHYLDLNRFKPVNDRFGHAVGDQLLAQVAQRMQRIVRKADVVARMGGDEFAILQRPVSDADDACDLARRILDAIGEPIQIESHELRVGASIGVAIYPMDGSDADALLRSADAAMYAAKASGHDGIRVAAGWPVGAAS